MFFYDELLPILRVWLNIEGSFIMWKETNHFYHFTDDEFKEQGELVSIVQDLADGDTSSLGKVDNKTSANFIIR